MLGDGPHQPSRLCHHRRNGIIDEPARYEALSTGNPAGTALDVFDQEPPSGPPSLDLENVILSSHYAGLRKEAAIRMAISTARNALAALDGKLDPSMVVNREIL